MKRQRRILHLAVAPPRAARPPARADRRSTGGTWCIHSRHGASSVRGTALRPGRRVADGARGRGALPEPTGVATEARSLDLRPPRLLFRVILHLAVVLDFAAQMEERVARVVEAAVGGPLGADERLDAKLRRAPLRAKRRLRLLHLGLEHEQLLLEALPAAVAVGRAPRRPRARGARRRRPPPPPCGPAPAATRTSCRSSSASTRDPPRAS